MRPPIRSSLPSVPFQAGILSRSARCGLMVLVVCAHLGILWAVMQVVPPGFAMTDRPPMTVRLVEPETPAQPEIAIPLLEDTPPPVWQPELASMIPVPEANLPPPLFTRIRPAQLPRQVPPPQPAPETPPAEAPPGLRTVTEAQVVYVSMPNPIYPEAARRAGQFGSTLVKVLVDSLGMPADVVIEKSSTHPLLDAEALRTMRLALFRPYLEDGLPQPVWVLVPVHFMMLRQR